MTTTLEVELNENNIRLLVHQFYDNVRIDPLIGPVFQAAVASWDHHLDLLTRFWCSIMLATRTYKGNPLAVHFEVPVTPEMFSRWLALWGETVDAMFVPHIADQFKAKAFKMGQNMQFALFGKK